jgi:ribonuclease E
MPSGTFIERPAVDAGYSYFSQPSTSATTGEDNAPPTAADAVVTPDSMGDAERPPREKRSRDRYGRDRRERNGGGRPREGAEGTDATGNGQATADHAALEPAAATASFTHEAVTPVAPPQEVPAPATAPSPVAETTTLSGLPRVAAYVLPLETLQSVAEGAGLEWINSDAGRVALAQASIAATPVAPHVPRTPKPVVLPDDGPLVLVETRRDLKALVLPFDAQNPTV